MRRSLPFVSSCTAGMGNGDKCAWSAQSANTTMGAHTFAVQPIWSNRISGCAMS